MELKRKLDAKTDEFKLAEGKVTRAAETGALTDEKIADIVSQLGLANVEKDELRTSNREKDQLIKELTEKIMAMQNRYAKFPFFLVLIWWFKLNIKYLYFVLSII